MKNENDGKTRFRVSSKGILQIPATAKAIEKWNIPLDVTSIRGVEFGSEGSSRLERIGDEAFRDCTELTFIHLPSGAQQIQPKAFFGCTKLQSITLPSTLTLLKHSAFFNCVSLQHIHFTKPSSLEQIGRMAFRACTSLQHIQIPSSVQIIGKFAFYQCSSLTEIQFDPHSQLRIMEQQVFTDCTSLQHLEIPKSVTTIGCDAFANCKRLTNISFQQNQSNIIGCKECLLCNSSLLLLGYINTVDSIPSLQLTQLNHSELEEFSSVIIQYPTLQNRLNQMYCSLWPVFLFFWDLYIHIAIVVVFVRESSDLSTHRKPPNMGRNMALILLALILFLREFIQFSGKKTGYFFDIWNILDLVKILFLMASAVAMQWIIHREQQHNPIPIAFQLLIIVTGLSVIIGTVVILRTSNLRFARFVGGVLQMIPILVPFLIVSLILLFSFAFLCHLTHEFRSSSHDETKDFGTLMNAFQTSLLFFATEPDGFGNHTYDILFGLIFTAFLLNGVIIAVVNEQWTKGEETKDYTFWEYRIYFLADPLLNWLCEHFDGVHRMMKSIHQFQNRNFFDNIKWSTSPFDKLNDIFEEDFQCYKNLLCYEYPTLHTTKNGAKITIGRHTSFIAKGDPILKESFRNLRSWQRDFYWVLSRKFSLLECILLMIQFILHLLCVLLGPFTFGLLWHDRLRQNIFSHTVNSDVPVDDRMQNLETKILNLEDKVEDRIANLGNTIHHKIARLENKLNRVLDILEDSKTEKTSSFLCTR